MKKILLIPILFILMVNIAYAVEMLSIDDFIITYNSESQRNLKDGATFNEIVEPGEDIDIEIELKNNFKNDTDIVDIEIIAAIKNITTGNNIIDKTPKFDLLSGKSKVKTLSLSIPNNAEELTKTLNIFILGIDEDGNVHTIERNIYLNIEDPKHNVIIYNTYLNQSIIRCNQSLALAVWVYNDGKYDEDDVILKIKSDDLEIDKLYKMSIDKNEKFSKSMIITPKTNKIGSLPILLDLYYKTTILDDQKTINLSIESCPKNINDTSVEDRDSDNTDEGTEDEIEVIESEDNPIETEENKPVVIPAYNTNINTPNPISFWVIGIIILVLLIIMILALQIAKRD